MADYKRWISYIYCYEEGIKKNNIGYVRVESLGQMTKITVHINVLSVSEPMKAYLFVRMDNYTQGICIGDVKIDKGVGRGIFTVNSSRIADSRFEMSETGGILIYYNDDRFFASEWDDRPIVIEQFRREILSEPEPIEIDSKIIEPEIEKPEMEKPEIEKPEIEVPEMEEPEIIKPEIIEPEIIEPKIIEPEIIEPEIIEPEIIESDIKVPELNESKKQTLELNEAMIQELKKEKNASKEKKPVKVQIPTNNNNIEKAVQQMLDIYPRMYPFEDDEMIYCVRIEPQDISRLPIESWNLANNSFLLRGYYCYRHLMLMKTSDKNHPRLLLGVPGIYHNKDSFIAKMFGFELFKPMKKTDEVIGEFGYWCIFMSEV